MSFIVYVSEPRKRSRNSFEFQSTSKSGVNPAHNCTQNRNSNFADLSRLPGRTVARHADLNSPDSLQCSPSIRRPDVLKDLLGRVLRQDLAPQDCCRRTEVP